MNKGFFCDGMLLDHYEKHMRYLKFKLTYVFMRLYIRFDQRIRQIEMGIYGFGGNQLQPVH
jgi:hypothetical protein